MVASLADPYKLELVSNVPSTGLVSEIEIYVYLCSAI